MYGLLKLFFWDSFIEYGLWLTCLECSTNWRFLHWLRFGVAPYLIWFWSFGWIIGFLLAGFSACPVLWDPIYNQAFITIFKQAPTIVILVLVSRYIEVFFISVHIFLFIRHVNLIIIFRICRFSESWTVIIICIFF